METEGKRIRPRVEPGPALNYVRNLVGENRDLPDGWESVRAAGCVGRGVDAFDALSESVMRLRVFAAAGMPVHERAGEVVTFGSGILAGPARVVERVDESLVQGIALGTTEGNPHRGELRVELSFDERAGDVVATAQLSWQAGGFVLPGAADRERGKQRKGLRRLIESLGRDAA